MLDNLLEPVDYCSCGDIGYLTTRSLDIDLLRGTGKIHKVPVYHCQSDSCPKYTVPLNVARRLEELADKMEAEQSQEIDFYWEEATADNAENNSTGKLAYLQAFLLQIEGRVYEDVKAIALVPEQAVIFQSLQDPGEYYILQYEPEQNSPTLWLSLAKFYYDKKNLTLEDYRQLADDGLVKELGIFALEDTEEALEEEFGNII
jgi:hypothetical protein